MIDDASITLLRDELAGQATRCPHCRGTGWAPDIIHPLFGQMLDCNKSCPHCDGEGWLPPPSPPTSEGAP